MKSEIGRKTWNLVKWETEIKLLIKNTLKRQRRIERQLRF